MSVREVQTAAARVIHVDRISDTAIQEVKTRFRYHPLDIEALFSVPVESSFSTYGDYGLVTLLWPDATTQDLHELRLFVDRQHLTIVGDTADAMIANIVEELHKNLGSDESQLTAPELVHYIIQRLRQPWQEHTDGVTAVTQHHLIGNAQVLRQLGRWLQSVQLPTAVQQLVLDAHALDSLSERPQKIIEVPTARTGQSLPSLLRGYAAVSALMVIVVIVTLSVQ